MADLANITERLAFTSQALATLGGSPEWDAALTEYLKREALVHADSEYGDYFKANEADDRMMYALEQTYGKDVRSHPIGRAAWEARWDIVKATEARQSDEYLQPMWAAQRALVQVPAPSLAAAVFKATFIARDEVWNDSALQADCMAIVEGDFARLAGA